MLIKTVGVLRAADPAMAATGDGNGAGQEIDPVFGLANLLSQNASAPNAESNDATPVAEAATPEEPPAPAQEEEPGQETLPPEGEPNAEGDTPEAESDEPNEPEQDGTQPAEFARLSPAERKAALELVKQLQPGEIPRIAKLVAQRHQLESTVESLSKQLEEAQSAAVESRGTSDQGPELPEAITKLKTVQEVQKQLDGVTRELEAVQDFLDANPGDAETVYQIGGKEMSRKALIELRAGLRAQARQLPVRGQQILDQTQLAQARQRVESQLVREFPVLQDPEQAITKTVRKLMTLPDFAGRANGMELAYIMARGNEVVTAERQKRQAGVTQAPLVRKPVGTVPAKKPLVSGANAAGRTGDMAAVQAARQALDKDGSTDSFAALLRATGAGQKR
jgi:hypothetical protein